MRTITNNRDQYEPFEWDVHEISMEQRYARVKHPVFTIALDAMAPNFPREGTPLFLYDFEQEIAGLDKVYGSSGLEELTEETTFNGVTYPAGTLVFPVTKIDTDKMTTTVMVEKR